MLDLKQNIIIQWLRKGFMASGVKDPIPAIYISHESRNLAEDCKHFQCAQCIYCVWKCTVIFSWLNIKHGASQLFMGWVSNSSAGTAVGYKNGVLGEEEGFARLKVLRKQGRDLMKRTPEEW